MRLKEEVTGFLTISTPLILLAKDVELEFRGVSSKTTVTVTAHMLSRSVSGHVGGGYGPFSASVSSSYKSSSSNIATEATADGLRIRVPGAQLIGCYVTVVPEFPTVGPIKKK